MHNRSARARTVRFTTPVAVIGALATVLTAAPAEAAGPVRAGTMPAPAHSTLPTGLHGRTAAAVHQAAAAPSTYTVKPGDTASSIAIRHGLRPADVLAWNGLGWRSVIYPGQKLRLTSAPAAAEPAAKPAQKPVAAASTHTVVRGETVYAIARKYRISVSNIIAANGLGSGAIIYPGQKLRVGAAPAAASTPSASAPKAPAAAPAQKPVTPASTHTVARGETVYAIARKYRTSVSNIIAANGLGSAATIYPGQKLRVGAAPAAASTPPAPKAPAPKAPAAKPAPAGTAAAPAAHKVVPGDTLIGIAKKYRTSVSVLLQANGLGNGSIIYPGQSLRLAPPAPAQRSAKLDATQQAHAVHIIRVGRELGVPDRGIAIALATAMVESSMRNLDHGDRDSLGLFQQRPSQGWGTAAQILDADRSIRVFYGGRSDPNGARSRGLLDLAGWQDRSFTAAAQAVQISAYPDRYGQWESQAHSWLASLR